jgi:hypothetical protein
MVSLDPEDDQRHRKVSEKMRRRKTEPRISQEISSERDLGSCVLRKFRLGAEMVVGVKPPRVIVEHRLVAPSPSTSGLVATAGGMAMPRLGARSVRSTSPERAVWVGPDGNAGMTATCLSKAAGGDDLRLGD